MKIELVNIVLMGLATWRLTSLLGEEAGPFKLFTRLREVLGIEHYCDGLPMQYPNTFFGKLWSCVYCLSVWVAGFMVAFYVFLPDPAIIFALWLSLSTITILIEEEYGV